MAATFRDIRLPKWNEIDRYVKDTELLTSEILFLILTLSNVFVLYKLFQDIIPYPIFVTTWQVSQSLLMAYILGETGTQFQKLQYFPRVKLDINTMKQLILPTVVYTGMVVMANILLYMTPCVSTFPVIVSLTVVMHHLTRFLGCGDEFMPMRWQSIGILSFAFLLGCTDNYTVSLKILPVALLFSFCSAAYRAGYLQKLLHVVDGRGNFLHNNQSAMSVALLCVMTILFGEWQVLFDMPWDILSLHTWQTWGCLVTAGTIPFLKNIVANRLIRRTGQGPWRFLEITSIAFVFLFGLSFSYPNWQGCIAILLVILGRGLGAFDVVIAQAEQGDNRGGGNITHIFDQNEIIVDDAPFYKTIRENSYLGNMETPYVSA